MPPDPPLPAGTQGIHHVERNLSTPLTPEEMFRNAVQPARGFESDPANQTDGLRKQSSTLPPNWSDKGNAGQAVGAGRNTVGAIQIVDKNGRRVGFATGIYTGGGDLEKHAEPIALRGLTKNGPPGTIDGGKMIVVLEKTPCEHCRPKLIAYAQSKGLSEIEIHLPERPKMVGSGMATPKQTSRTSFMANRPAFTIKRDEVIKMPPRSGPTGGSAPAGSMRTAVIGAMANLAAGVALDIFRAEFKAKMLRDLENLPKPKIDKRSAQDFFTDPNLGKGLRAADVLSKNLAPFASQLSEHHQKVIITTNLEVATLAVSSLSFEARMEFLGGLREQLDLYFDQLLTVRDNLEEVKKLEAKCLESAQGAEDLSKLVERALIADWLLKQGFSFEEIVAMWENLKSFASRVRSVFRDVNALLAQVESQINESNAMASSLSKLSWGLIFEEAKKRGAVQ